MSFESPLQGIINYVAVKGGIEIPLIMNSRSTYLTGSFGGQEGRVLKKGDVLFNNINFGLNPSGREINSKVEYLTSYKNIGIGMSLGYKSDPYHIKFMEDYWYASLGFNIKI